MRVIENNEDMIKLLSVDKNYRPKNRPNLSKIKNEKNW